MKNELVVSLANFEQHLSRAENNELFISFIGENKSYIDWKFIALYYSALHFGDAFIAKKLVYGGSIRIRDHNHRKELYHDHFDEDTFTSYERLEDFSRKARYHPEKNHILNDKLFEELFTEDFSKMKSLLHQYQ